MMKTFPSSLLLFFFLVLVCFEYDQPVSASSLSRLVSIGVQSIHQSVLPLMPGDQRSGFLPSFGNIFLTLVFGHLILSAVKVFSSGGCTTQRRLGLLLSGIGGAVALLVLACFPHSLNSVEKVENAREQAILLLQHLVAFDNCGQAYGFLPCSRTVIGNVLLILAYGYLMFWAAKFLSDGSEILLEILGPGIIGGLVLPILSSLPDAIIILSSGLSGSKETAQDQVSVGMGLLSGSIVMLLTLLWGSCIVVGKCNLEDGFAIDEKDTKGFSLTGSGITTDIWTSYAARIMVISVTPFIVVQLPQVLNSSSDGRSFILIALVLSISFLISYCLYQVFQPKIQRRRIAFAKYKHVMSGILKSFKKRALGRILNIDGKPNREVLEKLFKVIDVNGDGHLSAEELKALIIGIPFDEVDLDVDDINDAVNSLLKEFDKTDDSLIDLEEFINGISEWIYKAKSSGNYANDHGTELKFLSEFYQQTRKEHDLLGDDSSDDDDEGVENPKWNAFKAVLMLLLGTSAVCVFADPLVDAVNNFSTAAEIPKFFVSFVVLPFASCSEAVSSLIFIRNKRQKTASLTFSQIYGSVTMSNILCLSVFLGLVYIRGLTWHFSSEVLIILVVCSLMGTFASFRTTFPLWTCLVAFALYPLSIVVIYVCEYVIGMS